MRKSTSPRGAFVLPLLLLGGVGGCSDEANVSSKSAMPVMASASAPAPVGGMAGMMGGSPVPGRMMGGMMGGPGPAGAPAAPGAENLAPQEPATAAAVPPALPRKILYTGNVSLVVESIATVGDRIASLVNGAGGYISDTSQTGDTSQRRQASWTVRVPVAKFDALLNGVSRLGELQSSRLESQDVSQEFFDVEARISNAQQEEKRLLKHLADSTGKLADILAVEREVARVRGEIEGMQGRIRFLTHHAELSTLTIAATEIRGYAPPVEPTFAARVSRTFHASVDNLVAFCGTIALVAVALVPWLPFLILPFLMVWAANRFYGRSRRVRAIPR